MNILFEFIQPLGNAITRQIFTNRLIEEDSVMSDALGGFALVLLVGSFLWFLIRFVVR